VFYAIVAVSTLLGVSITAKRYHPSPGALLGCCHQAEKYSTMPILPKSLPSFYLYSRAAANHSHTKTGSETTIAYHRVHKTLPKTTRIPLGQCFSSWDGCLLFWLDDLGAAKYAKGRHQGQFLFSEKHFGVASAPQVL
jgi:hypothetical protein